MIELPFAIQKGDSGFSQNSRETLINMYAEKVNGKAMITRRQRPGFSLKQAIVGARRGIAEFSHGHYLVIRDTAYRWNGTNLSAIGNLDTKIGPVTIVSDDNGEVAICDGISLYHWDGTTFSTVDTPTTVGTVTFQGGFGIYNEPGTDRFYVSALNDLTDWDALDFASAESQSDDLMRVFEDRAELWLFGGRTIDVYRNSGAVDFPYAFNTAIQRGAAAAFSVASDDNTIFWLGDDKIVYRADGYRPARVSTHEVESWLDAAPNISEAEAFIYSTRGHKFYTLTVPGYGTAQLNIATGLWNGARSWGFPDLRVTGGAGRPVSYYIDDRGIVELDNDLNTDSGVRMERGGVSAPVYNRGERMTFSEFWMNCEVGRVAEGTDEPQVMLQVSRNGEEFGSSRARGLGETGGYDRRVSWRGLGQARQFTLKYTVTDDVAFKVTSTGGVIS